MMTTSLKTWCLLPLALLLLLLLFIDLTGTEVVKLMSDCKGFLLEEETPQIPGVLKDGSIQDQSRYKVICQTFENKRRFVTLYDTQNKIPVFSAYKFTGGDDKRPEKQIWKIEPELEGSNMNVQGYFHQAVSSNYDNKEGYDKGHLFPSSHAFDETDKISTFTLTNIVPQAHTFNEGSWNNMERCVKCILKKYCTDSNGQTKGYVVTGAKPGTDTLGKKKINIPSALWSAFCCHSNKESEWLASAHWAGNVPEASPPPLKFMKTMTLEELQNTLFTEEQGFEVFPKTKCPPKETVAKFYSDIDPSCRCPSKD